MLKKYRLYQISAIGFVFCVMLVNVGFAHADNSILAAQLQQMRQQLEQMRSTTSVSIGTSTSQSQGYFKGIENQIQSLRRGVPDPKVRSVVATSTASSAKLRDKAVEIKGIEYKAQSTIEAAERLVSQIASFRRDDDASVRMSNQLMLIAVRQQLDAAKRAMKNKRYQLALTLGLKALTDLERISGKNVDIVQKSNSTTTPACMMFGKCLPQAIDKNGARDQKSSTSTRSRFACTMDVHTCPDGTVVGRTGPSCVFRCPRL